MGNTNTETLRILINAQDNASAALGKLQNNIVGVGVAWLSWQGAKKAFDWTIGAAIESERVWAGVTQSIKNTGQSVDRVLPIFQRFSKEIMYRTGESDEAIGEALGRLNFYNMEAALAMRTVSAALDLAAAKNMDLMTAVDLLGRASKGHVETLARYGIMIKDASGKTMDFADILKSVEKNTKGAADAMADTTSGSLRKLKESFGEFSEALGVIGTGGVVSGFAKTWANNFNTLTKAIENTTTAYDKLRGAALLLSLNGGAMGDFIVRQAQKDIPAAVKGYENLEASIGKTNTTVQGSIDAWSDAVGLLPRVTNAVEDIVFATTDWTNVTNDLIDKFREQDTALKNTTTDWLAYMKVIQSGGEVSAAAGDAISEAFNASLSEAIDNAADGLERAEAAYQKILKESNTIPRKTDQQSLQDEISGGDQYGEGFSDISKHLQDTQKKASKTKAFLKEAFSGAVFDTFNNAASNAASMLTRVFMGEKVKFVDLWKSMASDFLNYFLQEILKQAAIAIAKLIIQFAMFDNPKNDAIAYRSGRDYMKHFTNGMNSGLPDAGSFSLSPAMAGGGGSFGGGGTTVIMIGGGSDYESMRKRLEKEVSNGSLDLITRRNINQALITMKGTGR
jgi:hypothetical protein